MKTEPWTLAPGMPDKGTVGLTMLAAVRIARRFPNEPPTVQQLQRLYGVHRATAYRWRAAFLEAIARP